jgi:hypothetical protein
MPGATRCPFAAWRPISANYTPRGRKTIRGFVPHVQVGYGSLWEFFNTPKPPGQGASADFWCSQSGVLEQYVDLRDAAWAQGSTTHNGNPYMASCEFEGQPSEPMTPAQIQMGGHLIAWLRAENADWPLVISYDPNAAGVMPHHVFGGGHTCPCPPSGPCVREAQFPDLVAAASGPKPPPTPVPAPPVNLEDYPVNFILSDSGALYLVDTISGFFAQNVPNVDAPAPQLPVITHNGAAASIAVACGQVRARTA